MGDLIDGKPWIPPAGRACVPSCPRAGARAAPGGPRRPRHGRGPAARCHCGAHRPAPGRARAEDRGPAQPAPACLGQGPAVPAADTGDLHERHHHGRLLPQQSVHPRADDHYSAWGCAACHTWLDQRPAPAARKEAAFMAAHLRQVLAWRALAGAPNTDARDRAAVLWALGLLNAIPILDF
jgi:hypothetical protein